MRASDKIHLLAAPQMKCKAGSKAPSKLAELSSQLHILLYCCLRCSRPAADPAHQSRTTTSWHCHQTHHTLASSSRSEGLSPLSSLPHSTHNLPPAS